jgi:hypothetical protein
MSVFYTDEEIQEMIREPKQFAADQSRCARMKQGHREGEYLLESSSGKNYILLTRQGLANPLDFSVILAVQPLNSNQRFRLRRYNGKSHEHTNKLEGERFFGYHIHTATMRYQEFGMREDGYAEICSEYYDLASAIRLALCDCSIDDLRGILQCPQRNWLEEVEI